MWYLEYTYYGLLCRQKLSGGLGAAERQQAETAIEQGHFLSEHVNSPTDLTMRYTGFLHFMCHEFTNAIPCFLAVQNQQTGIDRLAVDQALFACYLQTFDFDKAREVLTSGAAAGGIYAERYQALLSQLPALEKARMGATNSTGRPPG